jgi:hypothetical protein
MRRGKLCSRWGLKQLWAASSTQTDNSVQQNRQHTELQAAGLAGEGLLPDCRGSSTSQTKPPARENTQSDKFRKSIALKHNFFQQKRFWFRYIVLRTIGSSSHTAALFT